jgi:predicted DNA-binding transcriptional regulator AlpA
LLLTIFRSASPKLCAPTNEGAPMTTSTNRWLRTDEVLADPRFKNLFCRSTLYKGVRLGQLPPPRKLANVALWDAVALEAAIEQLPTGGVRRDRDTDPDNNADPVHKVVIEVAARPDALRAGLAALCSTAGVVGAKVLEAAA